MAAAVWATLALLQDPSIDELIRRLTHEDPRERDAASEALIERGVEALAPIEAARKEARDPDLRVRLDRVRRAIELADHVRRLPDRFSEAFRAEAAELIERLSDLQPAAVLDALSATTGVTARWNPDFGMILPDTAVKLESATAGDAVEVVRTALRAMPVGDASREWTLVKYAIANAGIADESGTLLPDAIPHLDDPDPEFSFELQGIVMRARDPEHVPALLELAGRNGKPYQETAAWSLSWMNPGDRADAVAELIEKVPLRIQAILLGSLAATRDRRFSEIILRYVDRPDPFVQERALHAVRALDPAAIETIVLRKLESDDPKVVLAAVHASRHLSAPEICTALERLIFEGDDPNTGNQALYILAGIGPENLEDVIVRAFAHPAVNVRNAAAVNAKRAKQSERLLEALVAALEDEHGGVRGNAAMSLALFDVTGHEAKIRPMLDSGERYERAMAASALGRLRDAPSLPKIAALLDDGDSLVRMRAAHALGEAGDATYARALRDRFASAEPHDVLPIANALAALGDDACVEPLIAGLPGKNRSNAWDGLARFAQPDLSRELREATIEFKEPTELTVEGAVDQLRSALGRLEADLAPAWRNRVLSRRFKGSVSAGTILWEVYVACDRKVGWFADENGLHLLGVEETRRRWEAWAKARK